MNKSINLYPTPPAEWLWRDHQEDIKREFHPSVTIPSTDEPLWHECTTEEKTAYEEEWAASHPTEEVVEPNGDMPAESGTPDSGEVATQAPDTAEEGAGV